jgi:hypothetical protein
MYKLYWAPETGAMAPQILLEEVGADYERVIIDKGKEMEETHAVKLITEDSDPTA